MDILLVEDDEVIAQSLLYCFITNGHHALRAKGIKEAKTILEKMVFDVAVLDIGLNDGNGIDLYLKVVKPKGIATVFLTAHDDEATIVECFKSGAEEYIVKPFKTGELLIRLERAASRSDKHRLLKVKDITYDKDEMQFYKDGELIGLTALEKRILDVLFNNKNKVVYRSYLIEKIFEWTGNDVYDNTVTVYLKRIRAKIGQDTIKTIKGIGYMVSDDE